MYYQYALPKSDKIRYNPILGNPINALEWYNKGYTHFGKNPLTLNEYCIPCWSLAALLSYLNKDWYVYLSHDGICWQCIIDHHDRKERRCSSVLTDEPVDCCLELIVKLKEENLI